MAQPEGRQPFCNGGHRLGGEMLDPGFRRGYGLGELMAINWKSPKIVASIAVTILVLAVVHLYLVLYANSVPTSPPWADGGEAEWRKSLEQDFQRQFPKGTTRTALKTWMERNGYRAESSCIAGEPDDREACFEKQIYRQHHSGKAVIVRVIYDNDDKLVEMQFDYPRTQEI